jgi:Sigma-70 region 2
MIGAAYRRVSAAVRHGSVAHTRPGRAGRGVDGRVRERLRDGDPDAGRVVYRLYGSLVYGVAFRVLGDGRLCEEATQQTFLRAWRATAGFDASRELGPWLATIAAGRDRLVPSRGAARLGVPVGTVKSRSFRAHRRLALELGQIARNSPQARAGATDSRPCPAKPGASRPSVMATPRVLKSFQSDGAPKVSVDFCFDRIASNDCKHVPLGSDSPARSRYPPRRLWSGFVE